MDEDELEIDTKGYRVLDKLNNKYIQSGDKVAVTITKIVVNHGNLLIHAQFL